jgi:hypothetical protein
MKQIQKRLKLNKSVNQALKNQLYGPGPTTHLSVYQNVVALHEMKASEQKEELETYKSTQLRDIQSKISSAGKTGRKSEMIQGICQKLEECKDL